MLMYNYSFDEPAKAKKLYRNYALIIGLVAHLLAISIIFWRAGARGQALMNHSVTPVTRAITAPFRAVKRGVTSAVDKGIF